jgi:hypothetical protein
LAASQKAQLAKRIKLRLFSTASYFAEILAFQKKSRFGSNFRGLGVDSAPEVA